MTGHPIAEPGQRTPAPEGHVHSGRRNAFGRAGCLRGPGNRPPRGDHEGRGPASAVTGGRGGSMDEDLVAPLVLAVVQGPVRNVDTLVDDHERILSQRGGLKGPARHENGVFSMPSWMRPAIATARTADRLRCETVMSWQIWPVGPFPTPTANPRPACPYRHRHSGTACNRDSTGLSRIFRRT